MALGNVTNEVQTGGRVAGASASDLARTVVALNVSPGGVVDDIYSFSSPTAVTSTLRKGPLAEEIALLLKHGAGQVYGVPVAPSVAGAVGSVTQTGTGSGTVTVATGPDRQLIIKCSTGGALGTAGFKFSWDGGTTWSDEVISDASAPWVYRPEGGFVSLSFAAATYVVDETETWPINSDTATDSAGWVGTVTPTSSPIDNYDVKLTIITGGALGTATVRASLDGGESSLPDMAIPSGGVLVLPGTGVYLTFSGTFVADDTYSFLCCPPGFSTSDLEDALDALRASSSAPQVALLHDGALCASVAGAVSAGSTLSSAIATAMTSNAKFYQGIVECPAAGDTVVSGGAAIADTADTDSAIRTAVIAATDTNQVSLFAGTHRIQSALGSYKLKRPAGWAVVARYVEADPRSDVSEVGRGSLDVYEIGRDEWTASTSLHDARVNVLRSYPGRSGVFLAIQSGGVGWRNMTSDEDYQDAGAVRVLLLFLNAITVAGQKYLGSRQTTNSDGTIAESAAQAIDADLDGVAKRIVGLLPGGSFSEAQASAASASVDRTSQLGTAPKRLDVSYDLQPLGFVSSVRNRVKFSGVLPVTE